MRQKTHLNPFPVDDGAVHFQDGVLDRSRGRQDRHSNVDGVGPLEIQHLDFLGANFRFL